MGWDCQGWYYYYCGHRQHMLLKKLVKVLIAMLVSTALASCQNKERRGIGPPYRHYVPIFFGHHDGVDRTFDRVRRSSLIERIIRNRGSLPRCCAFQAFCHNGRLQQDHQRRIYYTRTSCQWRRCTIHRRLSSGASGLLLFGVKVGDEKESEGAGCYVWPLGPPAVIWFDQVSKSYEKRRWFASSRQLVALEKTSLVLEGPGPFALVGDSGAGKSTFLRLLCGDLTPSSGEIFIGTSLLPVSSSTSSSGKQTAVQRAAAEVSGAISTKSASPTKPSGVLQNRLLKAVPPGGVKYIDRRAVQRLVNAETSTVAQALATIFYPQSSSLSQQHQSVQGKEGVKDCPMELLLKAGRLRGIRNRSCRDLSRGQLLCLVLCVEVAHALADRVTGGECKVEKLPAPVLCLDEFLETEDARVRRGVEGVCASLCLLGVTIVFATHVMDHVEGMITSSATTSSTKVIRRHSRRGSSGGASGRVATFTGGQTSELRQLEECTYVDWKRTDDARRRAQRVI